MVSVDILWGGGAKVGCGVWENVWMVGGLLFTVYKKFVRGGWGVWESGSFAEDLLGVLRRISTGWWGDLYLFGGSFPRFAHRIITTNTILLNRKEIKWI
jgi:hypothetical protein